MKVWELIRVIEESPVKAESVDVCDVIFRTPEGFRYSVFFDCDEPDYLTWFEEPDGTRIAFWTTTTSPEPKTRAVEALAFLAGNLVHLPHVDERLKRAAAAWTREGVVQ